VGQSYTFAFSMEKERPEALFQLLDTGRYVGLNAMKFFRRSGDAPFSGDSQKDSQFTDFH